MVGFGAYLDCIALVGIFNGGTLVLRRGSGVDSSSDRDDLYIALYCTIKLLITSMYSCGGGRWCNFFLHSWRCY